MCFGETKLKQDKICVFGQSAFPVAEELLSLKFKVDIDNAQYICRSCVQLLKKRRGILNNLHRINCTIQEKYTTKLCTSGCVDNISTPFLSTPRKLFWTQAVPLKLIIYIHAIALNIHQTY